MKNKINLNMLAGFKGFNWVSRYSDTNETDNIGRWSRTCYYNGLCIGWVNGYVNESVAIGVRITGVVDFFTVSLDFPTSSQPHGGYENFTDFKECQKYVEEMFLDFKKIINK